MVKSKSYSPFRSAPWCFRDLGCVKAQDILYELGILHDLLAVIPGRLQVLREDAYRRRDRELDSTGGVL